MNNYEMSDSRLVSQYVNGNEEAFAELLERHQQRVYTTIFMIVKERTVAEDLMQETFIRVINTLKSGRYNESGKFLPWLLRIAHNLAVDRYRKKKRFPEIVLNDGSPVFNTMEFASEPYELTQVRKDVSSQLRLLIQELPDKQREVLVMRHYMGMSFKEIAKSVDIPVNTALGRMRYALINLRKLINKYNIAYDQNIYPK